MRLYVNSHGEWVGTQAEAKKIGAAQVDVGGRIGGAGAGRGRYRGFRGDAVGLAGGAGGLCAACRSGAAADTADFPF